MHLIDALLAWLLLALAVALAIVLRGRLRGERARQAHDAARHRAVLESISDAVVSVDAGQRVVLLNAAAERLFGVRRDAAVGTPLQRWLPEGPDLPAAAAQPSVARRQMRAVRADGRPVFVELAMAAADDAPQPLLTLTLRDVSTERAAAEALHRISERYRTVVEQSPDAIWLACEGRVQLANQACARMLGAEAAEQLVGCELSRFLPAEVVTAEGDAAVPAGGVAHRELRLRRLDGAEVEVELALARVPDHGGPALQGVMRDIGRRKQAEQVLVATQRALLQAQRMARLGYATLDVAGGRWQLSASMAELLGLPAGTTIAHAADWTIVHPDDRARLQRHLDVEVLAEGREHDLEYRIVRSDDGRVRWLHGTGSVERDGAGRPTRLFSTVQDITERKRAQLQLEESREELRRLSGRLVQAREDERRHLARELHDELGQRLTVLKLELELEPPSGETPPARHERLAAACDEAIAATRRLAADLRPALLDDLGLRAALGWLAAYWRRHGNLDIDLEADLADDELTDGASITLYRIVQEALTNVGRHSGATEVRVQIGCDDSRLRLLVEDNGRGFGPGDERKRESTGLTGIRERAFNLGGTAEAGNRAEGGCRLEVWLPLARVLRPGRDANA